MKILYLRTQFYFKNVGGSIGHTSGVINSLHKFIELHVISNAPLLGVLMKIEIIKPFLLKILPDIIGELFYSLQLFLSLRRRVSQYNYIYHRYSGFSYAAALLCRHSRETKLILEFNSSDVWKWKYWNKQNNFTSDLIKKVFIIPLVQRIELFNLQVAHTIVVVSQPLKDNLISEGIPEEKILVNPNGVDPEIFSDSLDAKDIRQRYNLSNNLTIGFIGTFGKWHGVLVMANAISRYLTEYAQSQIKFLIMGEGKLFPKVEETLHKYVENGQVILTRRIAQESAAIHLSACDILLSPHVKNPDGTKFFGSPTKLFEYMAIGKAIVASNLDQIGEILEHNKTAILVEPGNLDELVQGIHQLVSNQELRKTLGKNARQEVIEKFTWDCHVNNIILKVNEKNN